MSTTPTANISSKCSQSPSRLPEYDSQSAALSPSHPTPHHSPPDQDLSTSPPYKRQRHMAAERASSSSDSSSQSGIADNETEPEHGHLSERSPPQLTAPPKKKRTRTLTTPHQSAVLHALLAKVPRFLCFFSHSLIPYFPVPIPYHCHARRSRSPNRLERS